jgi:hypothetical protein
MSYSMTYEEQQAAWTALRDARQYVEKTYNSAEGMHDNYGFLYMDVGQWDLMEKTKELLARIDVLLDLEA